MCLGSEPSDIIGKEVVAQHNFGSNGDQRGPNDEIDSGIGSEDDHRYICIVN